MTELEEYFLYRCRKGMEQRGLAGKPEYEARLKFETDCILKMGFPGYFLIVWDILNHARSKDILVGPGRGSVAGALVAYCLKVTSLDPIQFGLMFERFLNPDRISMPDIDMDFPDDRRQEVIDYIRQRYGADHVANIGTFGQMKARGAVKAAARTLGVPEIGVALSKLLLKPVHGKPQPIAKSLEKIKELQDLKGHQATVIEWAQKLEGLYSSVGVHASGVVISNEPLSNTVPLFLGNSDEVTTQWDMKKIEDYGLVKFDILGLKTLTKVKRTQDLVKQRHNIAIDIEALPINDDETYATMRAGHTAGIFQLETSSGMRDLLVRIRPTSLEDITALVAIFRPGPLDSDYKDVYLAVRAGEMEPQYLIPELEPILKSTGGWMIYQEQVLRIANELCGMTKAQADMLRKAIGKKDEKQLKVYKPMFMEGWAKNNLPADKAEVLWDQIFAFADYAFNKSHAASYALVSYWTAFLKTHHPIEFMCANLICDQGNKDQVIRYIAECRRLGIDVLPPHVNIASESFSIEGDKTIRFGLGPIKNLGESSVALICDERRKNGEFKSFYDFCERVDLSIIHRTKVESLIKSGAMDGLGPNRASLLGAMELYWEYKKLFKSYESKLVTYQKKLAEYDEREKAISQGAKLKSKKVPIQPTEPQTPELPDILDLLPHQIMAYEHELLGFFISDHPLDRFQDTIEVESLTRIDGVSNYVDGDEISIAAVISSISKITTKKKANMAFVWLEDKTGLIEAVVFPKEYQKYEDLLTVALPRKFTGKVEVTEGEEETVYKLTISSIRELTERKIKRKKAPVFLLEIPVDKIKEAANIVDDHLGGEQEITINVILEDDSRVVFKQKLEVRDFNLMKQKIEELYE